MMKHTVLIAAAALLLACTTPAAAQTAVTEEVIREAEIIPDVIPAVNLDPKLRFALSFPSGDIDAGNLFSINASAAAPSVSISCNPGPPPPLPAVAWRKCAMAGMMAGYTCGWTTFVLSKASAAWTTRVQSRDCVCNIINRVTT